MTISIVCQIYLFICNDSQRFLITVNVWYFTLVNLVHIAVHDKYISGHLSHNEGSITYGA